METLVIIVHIVVALAIIGLILLQQGKGAEAGAAFGSGASQTVFGSQGGGNFFAKLTAILAFIFFVTSFTLAIIAKDKATVTDEVEGIPVEQIQEASDVPVLNGATEAGEIPTVVTESAEGEVPTVNQQ